MSISIRPCGPQDAEALALVSRATFLEAVQEVDALELHVARTRRDGQVRRAGQGEAHRRASVGHL
ncbi:MAG: hypothetical protein ACKOEY_16080, partial [Phenylobacterium sp.]